MKKFLFLLIIFTNIFVYTTNSFSELWLREDWKELPRPVYDINKPMSVNGAYKVIFIDSLNGYINATFGLSSDGVLKTTDGGYSWKATLIDSNIWKDGKLEYVTGDASGFDAKGSLALMTTYSNYYTPYLTDTGYVWLSTDTGSTWKRYNTGFKDFYAVPQITNTGKICLFSWGKIIISNDTGKTWYYSNQFILPNNNINWNLDFIAIDDNNLFVLFDCRSRDRPNFITFTNDGGITWDSVHIPRRYLRSIYITPDSKIWATGVYKKNDTGMARCFIDYSKDNGKTWINSLDTIFPDRWGMMSASYIKFWDNMNGAMCGHDGHFFRTADGGKHWYSEMRKGIKPDTMRYGDFQSFAYKTKDTIMLLLGGLDLYNPRLIVCPLLPLPVDTSSTVVETAPLREKCLVYPNPAKNNVSINFVVEPENLSNLSVELYNLTGILQSKLEYNIDYNDTYGQCTLKCNIENIPNGYYIIVIDNGKRKVAKPFIVNKE